ncbi:hypothetical protein V5O48_018055 [Marasmius crinis-equi]|uniref:F-box domain-containing protein n=1 Tax=Marasmius crinis-equi TaxID=585013 RepID=A0ABR3EM99_9AGAR
MKKDAFPFQYFTPSRAQRIQGMFRNLIFSRKRKRGVASRSLDDAQKEPNHSLLSPIHRLPPEILTEIFAILCVTVLISPQEIPDIMSISQVCCLWREIVLSTPLLWSDFEVTSRYYACSSSGKVQEDIEEMSALIDRVRLFLERSRNVPLTLTLSIEVGGAKMQELLSILLESADRWKDLDIRALYFRRPVLELLSRHLSSLQSLALTYNTLNTDPSRHWSLLRLPWGHLTKLEALFVDGPSLAALLRKCPRLKVLKLIGYTYSNTQTTSPITLSCLETLFLRGKGTPLLLGDLSLPNLTTLDFEDHYIGNWINDTHLIVESLQRSSCTIVNLAFGLPPILTRAEEMLAFLRLFPSLQTLSIESDRRDAIEHFIAPILGARSFLFPRLLALTLVARCYKKAQSAFIKQLLSVVLPRGSPELDNQRPGAGIAGLRPLIISIKGPERRPASDKDFANIQRLRDVGLRVSM